MNTSTWQRSDAVKKYVHILRRERTLQTLLLAGVIITTLAMMRPEHISPRIPDAFWIKKLEWRHQADTVLAGDSRVYMGLSPQAMNAIWPAPRIVNFGFSGVGYTRDFLDAVEKVLDPESRHPVIVLGITPQSLAPAAQRMNGFRYYSDYSRQDRFLAVHLEGLYHWLRPGTLGEATRLLLGRHLHVDQRWYEDGWVSLDQDVDNPNLWATAFRNLFIDNQVDSKVVDRVLDAVAKWARQGISVYGFRPPTPMATVSLENNTSGFRQVAFVHAFEQAGGVWLEFDPTAWHSYDGSHLERSAALHFSRVLAQRLVHRQAQRATPHPPTIAPTLSSVKQTSNHQRSSSQPTPAIAPSHHRDRKWLQPSRSP